MDLGYYFLGLSGMKDAVDGLNLGENPWFLSMIAFLKEQGFIGILMLVGVGTILTVIVQSSSAAMALTLSLCGASVGLPFEMAAAIVLGENIGTTITANLAALVGNVHAKRAARAHFIFNIFGVVWMLTIFFLFTEAIGWMMSQTKWGSPFTADGVQPTEDAIRYSLSAFHTVFNIINTLLLVWFVSLIERTVIRLTPSRGEDDEIYKLEYIGSGLLNTPELSVLEARKEVIKFSEILRKMHVKVAKLVNTTKKKDQVKLIEKITHYEEITDRMHLEIINFLTKLSNNEVTEKTSEQIRGLLGACNDLESICDIYYSMALQLQKKSKDNVWFIQKQRDNINSFFSQLDLAYDEMINNLNLESSKINLTHAASIESEIDATRDKLRKKHSKSIEKQEYNYRSGFVYNSLFSGVEKIGDFIKNVSESVSGKNLN